MRQKLFATGSRRRDVLVFCLLFFLLLATASRLLVYYSASGQNPISATVLHRLRALVR